jgi:hydroxyacylglutathione hydrolase
MLPMGNRPSAAQRCTRGGRNQLQEVLVITVEMIETPGLGDRSYLAHDGTTAIVIDPQRDIDRVDAILAKRGLTCAAVFETHVHNDYVTGGYLLAREWNVPYVLNAADVVAFERQGVGDGDVLQFGGIRVRVVATPGHTTSHLSYVVDEPESPTPAVVFTGGSLLYGSVGRTDLVDPALTEELTHAQYRSAQRLSHLLDAAVPVYPTHGFGSFCSAGAATGGETSTIGEERRRNDALTSDDEDAFVAELIGNLTAYPSYYAHMAPLNRRGPGPMDLSAPQPLDAEGLREHLHAGHWVVDLRHRTAYTAAHLEGTISIALGDKFATYVGWLMPWGHPLTLIGESPEQITNAQLRLSRIGIERPSGAAVGDIKGLAESSGQLRTIPRATFDQLAATRAEHAHSSPNGSATAAESDGHLVVLDVRRDEERAESWITGSVHVPIHELLEQLDSIPPGRLWVHCESGFRAGIAASLLERAGRDIVLVDDDYSVAVDRGLTESRADTVPVG